jgi:restriction system protein
MWEVRIQHAGLNAFRVVKGQTQQDAELKAQLQRAIWDERWARQQKVQTGRLEREKRMSSVFQSKELAATLSEEAAQKIFNIENLLKVSIGRGKFFKWDDLKDRAIFNAPTIFPAKNQEYSSKPSAEVFAAQLSLLDKLFSSRRRKKEAKAKTEFDQALFAWKAECDWIDSQNSDAESQFSKLVDERERVKKMHEESMASQHAAIDVSKAAFDAGSQGEVEYFFSEVLTRSDYPEEFPEEASVQYIKDSSTLLVDYELPNLTVLPAYKEVRYIASRNALQEIAVSETWIKKTYDEMLYQIALRAIHELFEHDEKNFLLSICFNGWVRSIDKATGTEAHGCIMSIQVGRDEFSCINLSQVEPKICFRKMKGVASSKLIELQPIRPVMSVRREDDRFVNPYAVLGAVDDRTNLAAMDWQDFENLIREVFEKEFSKNGGEVKITQASRDGGVDAVAFDPDPILGGKIVIQAKRYTNVVGVSAVRDLYGTVHNEGANKGILVTTSTYGPDAYEFAKGKPLTLLSGNELLYLLERHGHKSKINLAEAKIELKESERQRSS